MLICKSVKLICKSITYDNFTAFINSLLSFVPYEVEFTNRHTFDFMPFMLIEKISCNLLVLKS